MGIKSSKAATSVDDTLGASTMIGQAMYDGSFGPRDPLYRTWWYFVKATNTKDGSKAAAGVTGALVPGTCMMLSDAMNDYMDRMPRYQARTPILTFLPAKDRYTHAVEADTNSCLYTYADGHTGAAGTLIVDPSTPVPKDEMYPHMQQPTDTATAPAATKSDAHLKLRTAVTTVDANGSTSAKFNLPYTIERSSKANTLKFKHPIGVTYEFTTTGGMAAATASSAAAGDATHYHVTFVCLGNICRSPLGEGIFRSYVADKKMSAQFTIDSCGTAAYHTGEAPDERSIAVAAKHGVDISKQRAKHLNTKHFSRGTNSYLVVMDSSNLSNTQAKGKSCGTSTGTRVVKMLDFHPNSKYRNGDVPDPYYGGESDFQHVFDLITAATPELFQTVTTGGGAAKAEAPKIVSKK